MTTGLKHTLKEEYAVCYVNNDGKRCYANDIYPQSVNTTEDIDRSIKVKTLEQAKAIKSLCVEISSSFKDKPIKIVHVATIVEDIDDTYSAESE